MVKSIYESLKLLMDILTAFQTKRPCRLNFLLIVGIRATFPLYKSIPVGCTKQSNIYLERRHEMAPTHALSAHLSKELSKSWRNCHKPISDCGRGGQRGDGIGQAITSRKAASLAARCAWQSVQMPFVSQDVETMFIVHASRDI